MSGNLTYKLLVGIGIFLTLSCANPHYVSAADASSPTLPTQKLASIPLQFSKSSLYLSWQWEKLPIPRKSFGSLIFKFYRLNHADQTPVPMDPPLTPFLELFMPDMGHGSSPVTVEQLDVGTFRASNIFVSMPGGWQFKFQLLDAEAVHDEVIVNLTF